jgi:hypothetical protein
VAVTEWESHGLGKNQIDLGIIEFRFIGFAKAKSELSETHRSTASEQTKISDSGIGQLREQTRFPMRFPTQRPTESL